MNRVHFQSDTVEWGTPQVALNFVYEKWHPNLVLDVCAQYWNAKCGIYYSDGALERPWAYEAAAIGGDWWMNPPYGNAEFPCKKKCKKKRCVKRGSHCFEYTPGCADFVAKAYVEAYNHKSNGYLLIPARTDTDWWHRWIQPILAGTVPGDVVFWHGRLSFINKEGQTLDPAPFPSVFVQMRGRET